MLYHAVNKDLSSFDQEICVNGKPIERVCEFKFLGLLINKNVNWKSHTDIIANKVSRNLGVLNEIKQPLPQHITKTLYCSMKQSNFNFTKLAWGHESHRIEKLQKKTVRVITACKYNAHTDTIFGSLNLLKIADIFKLLSLKFYYNHVHHELPHYFQEYDFSTNHDVHNYETRQEHHIPANITRTKMAQNCVRHNVGKVVNSTDQNIMQSICL